MSKKLIIAISALALAVIAGVVAVVGVFAAQQQKVANTFTITYTANNVSAEVWGYYGNYEIGINETLVGSDNETERIGFTPADGAQTKSYTVSNIELTASSKYIVLEFTFVNTNNSGGRAMTVTIEDTSVLTNVKAYYAIGLYSSYDAFIEGAKSYDGTDLVISAQSTMLFSVMIEIDDDTLPASYVSTADKGLKFTLSSV